MVKDSPGRPGADRRPTGGWSDVSDAGPDVTWGVGAVSTRLGVAASTLRTWERRYGIGPSHRTQGGHRRYTERDIDRAELMRRMVARGVSAQDAARVVRHLDREALESALGAEQQRSVPVGPHAVVESILSAAAGHEDDRIRDICERLRGEGEFLASWRDVLSPALARMAAATSSGLLEAEAEIAAARLLLDHVRVVRGRHHAHQRPEVLLASSTEDAESLPFVALGAALAEADVALRIVGPEVGLREVVDLATRIRPQVLLLWDDARDLDPALRRHVDRSSIGALVRTRAAWPHELKMRFGQERAAVSTDVSGATRHVLDRIG